MTRQDSATLGRLFVSAPVNALVEGLYEENLPLSEVRKKGDFGLGTFNNLDGEMVLLDGEIYQVPGDGKARLVTEDLLTPFACVTFYRPLSEETISAPMTYAEFTGVLERTRPSPNIFYAFRMDGRFEYVRTRSVPRQENYRPLASVAAEQPIFEFADVEGTLAGFYTPTFMSSICVPGIHLHFITKDRRGGGHLLECRPLSGTLGTMCLGRLELALPFTLDYLTTPLDRDVSADLRKAER